MAVTHSTDLEDGKHLAESPGGSLGDAGCSSQKKRPHTPRNRPLAELRYQVGADQIVGEGLPCHPARQAHATAVVQQEIRFFEDLPEGRIPPGEIECVSVDDVDLPGLSPAKRRHEHREGLRTRQPVEADAEERDLISRDRSLPLWNGSVRVGNHGSCSSGRRPTKRSGISALTSLRRTTWSTTRSAMYTAAPPAILRARGFEGVNRSQARMAAAARPGRRISACRRTGKISCRR